MDKYISAQGAIKHLEYTLWDSPFVSTTALQIVKDELQRVSAADVMPIRHGRWIEEDDRYCGFYTTDIICSECNKISEFGKFSYCPNCGTKMDGESNV